MANCWRCGGQISSYASRCTWCGRSTSVSAFLQVVAFGTLIVAALFVGGLLPVTALTRYLPSNWLKASPLPPRSPAASEGAAGGGAAQGSGAGYGAVAGPGQTSDGGRPAASNSGRERDRDDPAAAIGPDCGSDARINLLAVRYADWSRDDLGLIACGRLREGFSPDQVTAARGRPLRRTRPDGQSSLEVWVYRDIRVVLDGDRVASIRER
jgi:hypothetical protein